MQTRWVGGFSVMWVPKLLLSPVKIRIFCPKTTKFGPKLAFWSFLARPWRLIWYPVGGLVGGCECELYLTRHLNPVFCLKYCFSLLLHNIWHSTKLILVKKIWIADIFGQLHSLKVIPESDYAQEASPVFINNFKDSRSMSIAPGLEGEWMKDSHVFQFRGIDSQVDIQNKTRNSFVEAILCFQEYFPLPFLKYKYEHVTY